MPSASATSPLHDLKLRFHNIPILKGHSVNVVSLTAENVKRLKAVRITPEDATIIVAGRNGQGKSSVLDAIQMALGGKDAVPDEPIRRGATNAKIILETDEFTVTRKFSGRGGTSIEVTNKAGLKYPSPQAVLDALTSSIGFDPLAFSLLKDKEQAQVLRDLVGIDTTQIDADRKAAFDERTTVNRQIKSQRAIVDSLPPSGPAMVDVSAVMVELEGIRQKNREREDFTRKVQRSNEKAEQQRATVVRLERELEFAKAGLQEDLREVADLSTVLENMPATVDTAPLVTKIQQAGETNKQAAKVEERKREAVKLEQLDKQAGDLTAKIDQLDDQRHTLVTTAKFPVEGLGFSESGVTFNGIPFSQSSRSEQIRVGMAVAIKKNPEFKVILIRDGSLLDEDAMQIVSDMASESGFQVWIERVGTEGQCTVLIEDGEAVEVEALAS